MAKAKETKKQSNQLERFHYTIDQTIEKPFNWEQMWRLLQFLKPYSKTYLPGAIIAMMIATAVRLSIPILIGKVAVDVAIAQNDGNLLVYLVAGIAILYIISFIANRFRIKWVNILGQNVIYDLRQKLFSHVQRLSHRFFDNRSAGSILVRILNDINSLQELFTNGIINLLMDILMLSGIIIILFIMSPPLALAVVIVIPLMFIISTALRRKIRRAWQLVRLQQSKMNSHLNEGLQGMRITQSFSQEKENAEFFDGVNSGFFNSSRDAAKKSAFFRPLVDICDAAGTIILIAFGSYLILNGTIELGTFISFAFFLGMFWEPISRLGQMYNQLLMAMASSERIFEFLDEQPNVEEKEGAYQFEKMDGQIEFDDVEFAYNADRLALKKISLKMEAGQTIALVGHTGSGKSTIANLISRFYDPTSSSKSGRT